MAMNNIVLIALCLTLFFHHHAGQLQLPSFMFSGFLLRGIQQYENNICNNRIIEANKEIQMNIQNALQKANLEAQKELNACQDNIPVVASKACEEAIASAVSAALAEQNVTAQAAMNECNANCNRTIEDAVTIAISNANATNQMKLENCLTNNCYTGDIEKCRMCRILSEVECGQVVTCSLTSENLCLAA